MDTIQIQIQKVISAPKWKVLRLITRLQDYPRIMPNVKQCLLLERSAFKAKTKWMVEMDHIPITWVEEDVFDLKNFQFSFRLIEGDLELFEGDWKLESPEPKKTKVTVSVRVRVGIPMIEQIMGNMLSAMLRRNFEKMLDAISERLAMMRYKNIRHREVSDVSGFAVIGHPYDLHHLMKYFKFFKPELKEPSRDFLLKVFDLAPAYNSYDIKGFKSKTGKEANGYFIMCPIVPDMLAMNPERVTQKVYQACKVAEELGVGIVTLGGFTSIAGERFGKPLASMVHVPVTTGNTFTTAMVIQGVLKAVKTMEMDLCKAAVTIIGGAGDIGSACARILSQSCASVTLTGRNERSLMEVERLLSYSGQASVHITTDNNAAVKNADIVIAAASAANSVVNTDCFKPGAIICDVGYPKNISHAETHRKDILIFSGGLTQLPSDFHLGFDIGMPAPNILYGCFAEAIILDLEERYENFSSGKGNITSEKVELLTQIGAKHGFEVAPFFWGDELILESEIKNLGAYHRS